MLHAHEFPKLDAFIKKILKIVKSNAKYFEGCHKVSVNLDVSQRDENWRHSMPGSCDWLISISSPTFQKCL